MRTLQVGTVFMSAMLASSSVLAAGLKAGHLSIPPLHQTPIRAARAASATKRLGF
jgi:hypothetical protein